jgi:outer membrane lipoprotein SlyB
MDNLRTSNSGELPMAEAANIIKLILIIIMLIFCGCAQQRPVLYPNSHLNNVGNEKAQADIDTCIHLAKQHGAEKNKGDKIARDTAAGAAVGAVAGAAIGAVLGNSVGRAAGVGAAGAGAATMTRKTIDSGKPDPLFRRFVEKCLHEKGYETIGWQ